MAETNDKLHGYDDHNALEIFSLIWFDSSGYMEESEDTDQKLRTVINQFKKFQDQQECRRYIEQRPQTDRLVLIVSG